MGPGVGPVGVRAHLAPYLPTHGQHPDPDQREGIGAISAAPYGSAGILPISWAYVRMMGADGLRRATATAVLSANYVAARLDDSFPVLYKGHGGLVAHECILDLRGLTKASGVTVDDVAKRLVDYGFHAPTMSFPVAGTLMVEPTESEDLGEIDRFCDAMLAIRAEIEQVERGEWSVDKSPLRGRAPHRPCDRRRLGPGLPARGRGLPDRPRPRQVLAAGRPDRPGVRRPPPGLLLPAARGLRRIRGGLTPFGCSAVQPKSPYSGRAPTSPVRPGPPDDLAGDRGAGGGPGGRRCPGGAGPWHPPCRSR